MSAESLLPSGSPSPHPSTTCSYSTQSLSSEEEDTEGEEESSVGESLCPAKDESPEEDLCLQEEEMYLKGKECLNQQVYLKAEQCLQKETFLEGKELLYERHLPAEFKAYSSHILPNLKARPASSKLPLGDAMPSTSSVKPEGEFLTWQDQSTQTEWAYENKMAPLMWTSEEEEATTMLTTFKSDSQVSVLNEEPQKAAKATEFLSKESFWDRILSDSVGTLESEDFEDDALTSSYQAVFRTVLKEMAARNELEEEIDISVTGRLESDARRKLGILLKKNFEKYKEAILWIMRKRENVMNQRVAETTCTYHLCDQPEVKEPVKKVKKSHVPRQALEIDTDWIKGKITVPRGDGKVILYPSETVFQILFPDGSGQIHYPSGRLALLILSIKEGKFTFIILEDSGNACIRALINNSGHATFYDENGGIWLSLSQNLGYYFAKDKNQKAWNWWDLNLHVHAPPVQPISLKINRYIEVQIESQDKVVFHFAHQKKCLCLNLGTKYKFTVPEVLREMKRKAVLEVEFSSTARKIQILLGKISRILNVLPVADLECFLEATKGLPTRRRGLEGKVLSPHLRRSENCPRAALAYARSLRKVELSEALKKTPNP